MANDQVWGNWKNRNPLPKIRVFPDIPLTQEEKDYLFKHHSRNLADFYFYIMVSKHCTERTTQDIVDAKADGMATFIRCLATFDKSGMLFSNLNYEGDENPKTLDWYFIKYYQQMSDWAARKTVKKSISDQKNSKRYAEQVESEIEPVKLDSTDRVRLRISDERTAAIIGIIKKNYSHIDLMYFLDFYVYDLRDKTELREKYGQNVVQLEKTRKKILKDIRTWEKVG